MFCTAALADTVIGNTLAKKIRNIGAASDTPNQKMARGIQAMGEMGRNTWNIGLNAWYAIGNQPRTSPTGTPNNTAMAKPQVTRNSEATMYLSKSPSSASSTMPMTTSMGVGKSSDRDKRTAACHRSTNA